MIKYDQMDLTIGMGLLCAFFTTSEVVYSKCFPNFPSFVYRFISLCLFYSFLSHPFISKSPAFTNPLKVCYVEQH